MKNIYFVIILLFVALFSFNINRSEAFLECNDTLDNDADGFFDFPGDPECTSLIDNDESVLGGSVYISYQDALGTVVAIKDCSISGDCSIYDGGVAGCVTGWSCLANDMGSACYVGISGNVDEACQKDISANCNTVYEACNCTCGGGGGGPLVGCAAPPGDADGDGDDCDYDLGENMFNCPADCLPAGVPSKLIPDVIDDIVRWLLTFAIGIAVLILVYGGVCYVFSSGDAQKTENAKKVVKYALLGIFIMGISYAIIIVADKVFH